MTKARKDPPETVRLLQEQVILLQATIEAGYRENEALRQELDKVYSSKSWQVTKPLHKLRRTVRARKTRD